MKRKTTGGRWVVGVMPLVVAAMLAGPAQADWNQTASGNYQYTNSANWSDGTPNGVWPATLSLNSVTQYVGFLQDATLNTGLSFTKTNGGTFAYVYLVGSNANRRITPGGDIRVEAIWPAYQANTWFSIGHKTAGLGLDLVLTNSLTIYSSVNLQNGGGFGIANSITSTPVTVGMTKTGSGTACLGGRQYWTGPLNVLEGALQLMATAGVLATTNILVQGGGLVLQNRSGSLGWDVASANRLPDNASVTSKGGAASVYNLTLVSSYDVAGTNTELFANLNMPEGYGTVRVATDSGAGRPVSIIAVSNLNRAVGTTLGVLGNDQNGNTHNNLGLGLGANDARLIVLNNPPALTNGIIPWALAGSVGSGLSHATVEFASYGAYGFTYYSSNGGTYVSTIAAAGATDNVRIGATESVTGTKTMNSLTINGGYNVSGGTVQLASGALLHKGAGVISSRLDLNGQEGVIFVSGTVEMDPGGGITNDAGKGVIFNASGTALGSGIILDTANYYTGPTRINAGDVVFRVANGIPLNSDVRIDKGGFLDLWDGIGGKNDIGSLSGSGVVTGRCNAGVTATLVVGWNGNSTVFDGILGNGFSGNIGLTKVGSGTLTLTGTSHTYRGTTAVTNGTLLVDGALAGAYSNIYVYAGATLGGTGWVDRVVSVQSNATLTAGTTNTAGTLRLTANLLMNAGSVLVCNITGSNACDKVVVGGSTVNLNADSGAGATLQVVLGYAAAADQQFTIVEKQLAGAITGAFANGGSVSATYNGDIYTFSISTTGGIDGNDVVLTVLPRGTVMSIE